VPSRLRNFRLFGRPSNSWMASFRSPTAQSLTEAEARGQYPALYDENRIFNLRLSLGLYGLRASPRCCNTGPPREVCD